ncbi:MAG: hypothetical protein K6F01_06210 [Selenomonas sp.]|uniref:hypothetical protein n=1 Tax=Selenomonas sp. TaxID=2053611 RepID=UPI0025D92A3E|nr:hypothetical protein [Selenomonas sp.]MCR5439016.1 hypothetical protein [Selenomonas sp.]
MSAFLGPIHYRMYEKIMVQEELLRRMADKAVQEGWLDSGADYVQSEGRPLEEIIDEANIHGWLSGRIESVEKRYAKLIVKILTGHEERLDDLKAVAYTFGAEKAAGKNSTAGECYQRIDDCTLDGMPCDGVNIVTDKSETHFCWQQRFDVHGAYWIEAGGKAQDYYALRQQFIAGILMAVNYVLTSSGQGEYSLCRND